MTTLVLRDVVPGGPSPGHIVAYIQRIILRLRAFRRLKKVQGGRATAIRAAVAKNLDDRMLRDIGFADAAAARYLSAHCARWLATGRFPD
jgi:hypothetical protein